MAVNDLLLPIVKGYGSERSWVLLGTESLQTFGGSGFLPDYPIEQYVRDAKIDTLYEGTTAIQGQDFFFRKIVKDQGRALGHLGQGDRGVHRLRGGNGRLKVSAACWPRRSRTPTRSSATMINDLMSADASAEGGDVRNIYKVGPQHLAAADGAGRRGLRLAAPARRRRGADQAGRRRVRQGQGVLRGQGRGGAVLRPEHAAPPGRRAGRSPSRPTWR
jgi:hypothetical protein